MSGWLAKLFRGQSMSRDEFRQRVMGMTAPGSVIGEQTTSLPGSSRRADNAVWMAAVPELTAVARFRPSQRANSTS